MLGSNAQPAKIIACLRIPFVRIASSKLTSVVRTIFWSGHVARCTTAIGVSSLQPASCNSLTIFFVYVALKNSAIVEWCLAKSRNFSNSGTGVRPSARVKISVCVKSGTVNSAPTAAAEANTELTPGIIL